MVDVQLHAGRSLDVVTQVETIEPFSAPVCSDYAVFTCASTMVETAERLTEDDGDLGTTDSPQQFLLAGWAPSCFDCARCGEPGPHTAFHVQAGGAVCASCRPAGSVEVSPRTMALLGALLSGDWALADASGPRERSAASGLVSAYVTWHLERRLRSLALVERT